MTLNCFLILDFGLKYSYSPRNTIYKNALSFKTVRLIQGLDVASQCNINNFSYENIDVFK